MPTHASKASNAIAFRTGASALVWARLSSVGGWLVVVAMPVFVYNPTGSVLNKGLAFVAEAGRTGHLAPRMSDRGRVYPL
jgi:hypothetical protein